MATGIFNRSALGKSTPPRSIDVERGSIVGFSRAIGEANPVHRDSAAAQAAGWPNVVAPVTFPIAIRLDYEQQLADLGVASAMTLINCDYARLLHGEERYIMRGRSSPATLSKSPPKSPVLKTRRAARSSWLA